MQHPNIRSHCDEKALFTIQRYFRVKRILMRCYANFCQYAPIVWRKIKIGNTYLTKKTIDTIKRFTR